MKIMNKQTSFSVVRLSVLAIITICTFSIISCNKYEDIEEVFQLEGTWVHTETDENGNVFEETLCFYSEQEGGYLLSTKIGGWDGSFWYRIKSPGVIHVQMTWYRNYPNYQTYREELDWRCKRNGDKLWIDDKQYTISH